MENIITEVKSFREQNQQVTPLFLLDRMHTSFVELFALTKDFVQRKDINGRYLDFYAGGVGTTLQQLMAGHSEYDAYEAITARRESYLFEAKMRSSTIGIASSLGYSTYRGVNPHILLTFLPSTDIAISPFNIIGGVGEYDIIALEEKSFRYGYQDSIKVAIGKLMEESITIPSAKTHYFRFSSDKVSEDIQLTLNDVVVEYSKDVLDLLNDKFITLSNSIGGIDVFYLNRFPPAGWSSMTRYTFYDYISPDYTWRPNFIYTEGQYCTAVIDTNHLPIFYECIKGGSTSDREPTWKPEYGQVTSSGETQWKCIGSLNSPRYFRNISPGINDSGLNEPVWPIQLGERVEDNNITWLATDTYGVSRFPYDTGEELKLTYIELEDVAFSEKDMQLDIGNIKIVTSEGYYQEAESIEDIRINAPLYHETKHLVRGREDYRKLFKEITSNIVDANGFDLTPAVVQLSYVKDHTTKVWEPDMLVDKGTLLMPSSPNGYIYRALVSGRTGLSTAGASALTEPDWNLDIDALTVDGHLTWKTLPLNTNVTVPVWSPRSTHRLNTYVQPTTFYGVMFQCIKIDTEPNWPMYLNNQVVDNEVTWECEDTIYLNGYTADYYVPGKPYAFGVYVQPVNPTGYFYKCVASGIAAEIEPDWPINICDTIIDGTCVWECYDLIDSPLYTKNTVLRQLPTYRPFGVEPNTIKDPILVNANLTITLTTLETKDIQTIKNDIDNILKNYQRILGITLTAAELENVFEQNLSYVQIARVIIGENSKLKTWQPGMLVKPGDTVIPTKPDGYIYKCQLVTLGSQNYTAWEDRGYSQLTEPEWPNVVGQRITEGSLVWEMRPKDEFSSTPILWQPDTIYLLDSVVATSVPGFKLYAKLVEIKFEEPNWPGIPGKSVKDNKIFWVCLDPNKSFVPLSWDEYYIFTRTIEIKR